MDSFWLQYSDYIVGIPAIVISTAVAVWVFVKQKNKKNLTYRITTDIALLAYHEAIEDQVEVFYNKVKVERIALQVIEFENNGNTPILKRDFDNCIRIVFDPNVFIFNAEVIYRNPFDLEVDIQYSKSEIIIQPLLLNEKDSFSIKILSNKSRASFSVLGRIVGIKNIKKYKENITIQILAIIAIVGFLLLTERMKYLIEIIGFTPAIVIFFLSFLAFVYFSLNSVTALKRRKRKYNGNV